VSGWVPPEWGERWDDETYSVRGERVFGRCNTGQAKERKIRKRQPVFMGTRRVAVPILTGGGG